MREGFVALGIGIVAGFSLVLWSAGESAVSQPENTPGEVTLRISPHKSGKKTPKTGNEAANLAPQPASAAASEPGTEPATEPDPAAAQTAPAANTPGTTQTPQTASRSEKEKENPPAGIRGNQPEAESIARGLLAQRDAAIMAGDRAQLQALTVPASPAAAEDAALADFVAANPVSQIYTRMVSARWTAESELQVLEVLTVQEELVFTSGERVPAGPERCARWVVESQPWRISEVLPCPETARH
ncbi:hypothetical protein [Actinobaculum suis]|uniref:hypothetical protein n=1 Tax=Actinobaculum suis TaxID=1657 RepID=UPI000808693B|nr:hypothetical protein [Actinobaculum suis]OCA93930.1 hypothetical protein ACU20_07295 [Actinobaculum suis]OCA94395.1 hypothetical protein ACU21_06680 [Actinobaculum suis]